MSEETAVLESSAPVEAPVMEASRGPLVNLTPEQRAEYKTTGVLPTPKTEEAAPSSDAKPTGEAKPAGDSETPPVQEKPKAEPKKQTAEERIAQLEATIEKIRKGSGLDKPKAESEPAKSEPAKPEYTRPKPTAEAKTDDGKPKYETYEDYIEDLSDWKAEQREATSKREQFAKAQNERLNAQIEDGRARYENFDEVIQPAANEIWNDPKVHADVKGRIGRSKILADLMFTLAENKVDFDKFVKMARENPDDAVDYIVITESLIRGKSLEDTKSEPLKEPPAKPITKAPKPPAEAGGRGTTPPDTLQAALEGSGGKLNAGLKAEFLRRDLARLKG